MDFSIPVMSLILVLIIFRIRCFTAQTAAIF